MKTFFALFAFKSTTMDEVDTQRIIRFLRSKAIESSAHAETLKIISSTIEKYHKVVDKMVPCPTGDRQSGIICVCVWHTMRENNRDEQIHPVMCELVDIVVDIVRGLV